MPYLPYDKENQYGPIQTSPQSQINPNQNPPGQVGKPKSSGQFVNIQAYLDANKDQASQMAQSLNQTIVNDAEKAQKSIQDYSTNNNVQVAAYNPSTALANPMALSDAQKNEYKQVKATGGYTGPESFDKTSDYQAVTDAVNKGSQSVNSLANEEGRINLVQQQFARPNYSAGMKTLDQALLQKDDSSKELLNNTYQKYSNINNLLSQAQLDVGNKINAAKEQALLNKNMFSNAEKEAFDNTLNPIKQRADDYNRTIPQIVDSVRQDMVDDTYNENTLSKLGLSDLIGKNLYNTNLNNYLKTDLTQAGVDNMANAEERARYAALAALIGDPTRTEITSNGQPISPVLIDRVKLDADLKKQGDDYNSQYGQLNEIYNSRMQEARTVQDNPNLTTTEKWALMGKLTSEASDAREKMDSLNSLYNINRLLNKG